MRKQEYYKSKTIRVEGKKFKSLSDDGKTRREVNWKLEIGEDDFGCYIELSLPRKPKLKINVVKEVYDYVREKIRDGKIDTNEIESLLKAVKEIT